MNTKNMKKYLIIISLAFSFFLADAQTATPQENPAAPKQEKAKTNTALWIALGTVFFCVYIALNAKKMKKKKE